MAVFLITATDPKSKKNYEKTLSKPIPNDRKKTLIQLNNKYISGDIYAWGFPKNDKNKNLMSQMNKGDICFFYGNKNSESSFIYAFIVSEVLDYSESELNKISNDFWDDSSFIPYLINEPIALNLPTKVFSQELDEEGLYFSTHVQSSIILKDEVRGKKAIENYGDFSIWALHMIEKYNSSSRQFDFEQETKKLVEIVDNNSIVQKSDKPLFKPQKNKQTGHNGQNKNKNSGKETKVIGDRGEEIIFEMLKQSLSQKEASTLIWTAKEGRKPGWDIEYIDSNNTLIGIEVKATCSDKFTSINITANELEMARKMEENYHLYLVSNCLKINKELYDVVINPAKVFDGQFVPTMYRI